MISPYKIKWAGFSSLDLDLWTELNFDPNNGAISTFLNRENITTEHYDGRKTIHKLKYNSTLTLTVTFIKQDYSDFGQDENRKVLSWLTSNDKPSWLEVYHDDGNAVSYRLFGSWTEIEQYKISNGRIIGYLATFESSAPYAYSRNMTYPLDPDNLEEIADYLQISEPTTFTITCNSDEYNKVIYPKVTVVFDSENVYVPINQNPTLNQYEMMSNIIYLYDNHYYVSTTGFKGEVSSIFSANSKISEQNAENYFGQYVYHPGNRILYKSVRVFELAKQYNSNVSTYYIDNKGTLPNEQPTAENFSERDYYVATSYGWEVIANIGTGVQIENTYVLNGEVQHSKSTIVGCKPKANDSYGERVTFDGTNKILSSSLEPMRIIGEDFNWEWLPFAEGENKITITGNCEIKFEWIEPRKVGSL